MPDLFISFIRDDRKKAQSISRVLIELGYSVWWNEEDLPREIVRSQLDGIIKKSKIAIILWSAISTESNDFLYDASRVNINGIFISVMLSECKIPKEYRSSPLIDLRDWNGSPEASNIKPLLCAVESKFNLPEVPLEISAKVNNAVTTEVSETELNYWRAICDNPQQSINEYKDYLNRFGENAEYAELANLRIKALENDRKEKSKFSFAKAIGTLTAVISVIVGSITIIQNYPSIKQIFFPCNEKQIIPEKFNMQSRCSGDWIFHERSSCEDTTKPIYAKITDKNICGYRVEFHKVQKPGYKTCRDITHGVERYANSELVEDKSGYVDGGFSQQWWCQKMKDQYQSSRPNVQIVWTDVTSSETSRRDILQHVTYNYTCKAIANWNPIYKEMASSACGFNDPEDVSIKIPNTCDDKNQIVGYVKTQNPDCEWKNIWTALQGSEHKNILKRFENKLVDTPICITCDELFENAEQRANCLLERINFIKTISFENIEIPERLRKQIIDSSKEVLSSEGCLTRATRKKLQGISK